jgi:hypothetical protein
VASNGVWEIRLHRAVPAVYHVRSAVRYPEVQRREARSRARQLRQYRAHLGPDYLSHFPSRVLVDTAVLVRPAASHF